MRKFNQYNFHFLLFVSVLFFAAACAPQNETSSSITLEASASGPFFSGPNSLIAEYDVNLASMDGLENVGSEQIKEIKVKSIRVSLNPSDSVNFSAFSSAAVQLVSSEVNMKTIAIKNPIETKDQELVFQVSDEAYIAEYFKGKKLSLVLDLDFKEDSYIEELGAKVVMEINVKHN